MLSKNAEQLLQQRYYKNGEDWKGLVKRNVDYITDKNHDKYYQLIGDRVFLPNSPSLVNAGTKTGGLFACFTVGPNEDTLEGGFNALTDIAMIAKKGGGCGFTGSFLRPKNSPVSGSAHGYAYGPNRFAKMVSYAMDAITQSGFRKMALMYTLSAEHPDIEEFIHLKQTTNEAECYNFNQSVFVKDDWMNRALSHVGSKEDHLLNLIAKHIWNNGEPGLLFEDKINDSPYKETGQYIYTTNPCAEQGLPEYGSCNLASINLNHEYFNHKGYFDYTALEEVVAYMTYYLDRTGTVNKFPTAKHQQWYDENRPIGIGEMGLADYLLRYGIKYGSQESLEHLHCITEAIQEMSYLTSERLGQTLGIPLQCQKLERPRRNITTVSIAPTGSIAMIADCSHGIEPIFSPSFLRVDERGQEYLYKHPLADEDYFVSAVGSRQATWKEQIDLVATAQHWVDSGISKTINLPNEATVTDVKDAIVYAWKSGCKGITLYRDGSRQFQVLNQVPTEQEVKDSTCKDGVCTL